MHNASLDLVVAHFDTAIAARVVRRLPMRYSAGPDAETDRPAHVRAASGLAWVGDRLAVVQDDANFIALVDPATGLADVITLPEGRDGRRQFDDGRGNKNDKLDLEALATIVDGDRMRLLALGSGSKRRRDRAVIVDMPDADGDTATATPAIHKTHTLHDALRERPEFSGSELNVEGAFQCGELLRLVNRGNGAPQHAVLPVDATGDVRWRELLAHIEAPDEHPLPLLHNVRQYELGALRGVRLTFTDGIACTPAGASASADPPPMLYTAAAEASPDASLDGDVAGSVIGIVTEQNGACYARQAILADERGAMLAVKVEGIARFPGRSYRVYIVIDVDAHDRPSELCEVELTGPWFSAAEQP